MMKKVIIWASCLVLLITACSSAGKKKDYASYPVHVYNQPYDFIYKHTLDILGTRDGWILEPTDKTEGIIEIGGTRFGNAIDMDTEKGRFIIRRISGAQTSVEFDEKNSHCRDNSCRMILEEIDKVLSALPPHQEVQKQQI